MVESTGRKEPESTRDFHADPLARRYKGADAP